MDVDAAKQEVRERIWALLDSEGASDPPGVQGFIPNFFGAPAAAERLAARPEWRDARIIKANPDTAQLPARARALTEGKLLYMAVPKIAEVKPFYLLDAEKIDIPPAQAALGHVAGTVAPTVGIEELRPVDMVVCGSVAVNREGIRIGKGAGYSDIQVALLVEAGLIGPDTTIVTTVHPLQLVDGPLPETEHDFSVDMIVTPDEVITCPPSRLPPGLMWEYLHEDKIAAIPVLAARAGQSKQ